MSDKTLFQGKFVKVIGKELNGIERELVELRGKDAVGVIILNEKSNKILLVKQQRLAKKGEDKTTWEIPAGMTDVENESLEDCLIREIKEETGLDVNDLKRILSFQPLIGCCNHEITLYHTKVNESDFTNDIDDSDVTEAKWFSIEEMKEMFSKGEIIDSKTLIAYFFII